MAQRGLPKITHQYRSTASLRYNDRADVGQTSQQSYAANHVALIAARDAAAASIRVVVVDCVDDIGDAEAVVLQLPWIEIELVLSGEPAKIGVIHHAGNGFQCRNYRPALDLGKLLKVLGI